MPNWCLNEVEIYCSSPKEKDEVVEFMRGEVSTSFMLQGELKTQVSITPISFNAMIPQPDFEDDRQWYAWNLINWGCKWEPDILDYNENEDEIHFQMMTPWSPPDGICDAIRDKFPDVNVNWFYREDGMQIAGWL